MRGEELGGVACWAVSMEIPPRARRRVDVEQCKVLRLGNTSACAEKSRPGATTADHIGNTSACAEKSLPAVAVSAHGWKYLRVRGEEGLVAPETRRAKEIPPRARRRVLGDVAPCFNPGNTSACAEKRSLDGLGLVEHGKYLRVRGEEKSRLRKPHGKLEIPPRARRRGPKGDTGSVENGNTSACAEKRASGVAP